jgi:hypothetical protein
MKEVKEVVETVQVTEPAKEEKEVVGFIQAMAEPAQETKVQKVEASGNPLCGFDFLPIQFSQDEAESTFMKYSALDWKHIVLRATAIRAASLNDQSLYDEARSRADSTFMDLIRYTAVRCPYCKTPVQELNDIHLSNCAEMQKRYSGSPDKWNVRQCQEDNPGIQMRSWLISYIQWVVTTFSSRNARQATPNQVAVIDKSRSQLPQRRQAIMSRLEKFQPNVPAVSERKVYVPPRFKRGK